MRRQLVDQIAPPIYAAVDLLAILGPAVAVKLAADRGGMGGAEGVDIVVASAVLGAVHAVVAWSRLRSEERIAVRRLDLWIAALDALVVLGLGATLLPLAILYGFPEEHASLADRGYPVVALWVGVQVVAVTLAELTGRFVFWWLEPHQARSFRRRARIRARNQRAREEGALARAEAARGAAAPAPVPSAAPARPAAPPGPAGGDGGLSAPAWRSRRG